ncbi:Hsp70 family protein [Peribacillus sp. S4]|uniref:Hsp70 family protein n=1 Tax=Peribacillus sp. S4 TaxID=3384451 RepID=UPI003989E3FA
MYLGIDLGTTNSVVSYGLEIASKDFFKLVTPTNSLGEIVTPSVVYFEEGEKPLVGRYALDNFKTDPSNTVRWVKRHMGSDKKFNLCGKVFSPQSISACILKELKYFAEKASLEESISNVVITVPADFDTSAKQATIDAAKIAGFTEVHLISEPNAAILNYINQTYEKDELSEYFSDEEKYMLVFDLGGGTFDLSLSTIKIDSDGKIDTSVVTSSGNKYIGGINFDNDLMVYVLKKAIKIYPKETEQLSLMLKYNENSEKYQSNEELKNCMAQLIRDCEACKEYLSQNNKRTVTFFSHERRAFKVEISRKEFELLLKPYMGKIQENINEVLTQATSNNNTFKGWSDLLGVLLVGGSTNIPYIKEFCTDTFRLEPIVSHDVYISVSRGAAIYSSILSGVNSLVQNYETVVPHDFYLKNDNNYYEIFRKGSNIKQRNINYEIPFSLDTKAPIDIVQKYYNQEGKEIDVLLQTINYSHPFMFTGDTLEMDFKINEDLIISVATREDCIDDSVEIAFENKMKLSEEMLELEKNKLMAIGV